jgi:hypothetical protein
VLFFVPPRPVGALRVRVTAPGYTRAEEVRTFTAGGSVVEVTPDLIREGGLATDP